MNPQTNIVTFNLTLNYLQQSLDQFFDMEDEWTNTGQPPWSKEQFTRDIPHKWDLSFVAMVNMSIIGYVIASQDSIDHKTSRVNKIVIHHNHQRQGVGKLLMKNYINASLEQNMNRLELTAIRSYKPAQHLYKSLGYSKSQVVRGKDGKLRDVYLKIID
tara:strand:+ start:10610 stop:11086 length:477 start_codon:yes stop_codon:yes gene_type:complete